MGNRYQRARVGATTYDPAPVAVPGDSIAPPQIDGQRKAQFIADTRTQSSVNEAAQEGRSFTEMVVLTGNRDDVWNGLTPNRIAIITFLVPGGRSLWVDRIGWRFTDPFMHMMFSHTMEIQVNGQRVPWYREGGVDVDPGGPPVFFGATFFSPVGFQYPMGSICRPMPISTLYVTSGSLFELLIVREPVGSGEYTGISARVVGRLRKTAGGMS